MESGYYDSLIQKGLLRDEDLEPDVSAFTMYLEAFYELSSCRVNSMSAGPIPFTAISEYSKLFDVGEFGEFHYCIRKMDNEFLRLESAKSSPAKSASRKK